MDLLHLVFLFLGFVAQNIVSILILLTIAMVAIVVLAGWLVIRRFRQIPVKIVKKSTEQDSAVPPPATLFCTNCGNSVSGRAIACLSCGASPIGHKKFCRQCGVALNPEQIMCIKCGAGLANNGGAPMALQRQASGVSRSARQRKARIHFWTMLCTVFFVICTLTAIFSNALTLYFPTIQESIRENAQARVPQGGPGWQAGLRIAQAGAAEQAAQQQIQEVQGRLAWFILVLFVLTFIPYLCCYYFYLYRLWEEIPEEFARTTPGNAAGFALIPVFNLYWQFVAFSGLYYDLDKAAKSYSTRGNRFHTRRAGIKAICVLWLILGIVSLIMVPVSINEDYLVMLSLMSIGMIIAHALITIPTYWYVRSDVLTFIDMKESVGK